VTGFANSSQDIEMAVEIIEGVEGVKNLKNSLKVRRQK
jgi:osmotically-inducible protein OsmY